jgi:AcrR family transcriptional regulator
MFKGEEDMHERLQRAALELFGDRGYEKTTAAAIARRAGVTERTFYRYFPDKREVLFEGEGSMQGAIAAEVARAPAALGPVEALFWAFKTFAPVLEAKREILSARSRIISGTPALREREATKIVALANSLKSALQARGVNVLRAALASQAVIGAVTQANLAWLDDPAMSLAESFDDVADELKTLLA